MGAGDRAQGRREGGSRPREFLQPECSLVSAFSHYKEESQDSFERRAERIQGLGWLTLEGISLSRDSRVVWSEGMLLAPQHLQQWDRWVQALVAGRFRQALAFGWGFSELEIDASAVAEGQIRVTSARGVFRDGTPFDAGIGRPDPPPAPRRIEDDALSSKRGGITVHLAVRSASSPSAQVGATTTGNGAPRYVAESLTLPAEIE